MTTDWHSRREIAAFHRSGMQLLELVVSLASASLLMAGMASAVWIANRAAEIAWTRQTTVTRNNAGLDRLKADLAEAYPATNRTSTQATLSVSDRNSDGIRESIQYQWTGPGAPLEMSINSGAWHGITENLDKFNLEWRSCPAQTTLAESTLEPKPSLVYQSCTIANTSSAQNQLTIGIPATYLPNDLLIAAISVQGNQNDSLIGPIGWTRVCEISNGSDIALGIWATFSNNLRQTSFAWSQSCYAFASVAHFRSDLPSASLASTSTAIGTSRFPASPAGTANVDNTLVVRVLAAVGPLVVNEETNMPGHIAITMRGQALSRPIIGMAYRTYAAGSVPAAEFGLPSSGVYATATLVFQP